MFENHTLVELVKHMNRSQSRSRMGFYTYVDNVSHYCRRLEDPLSKPEYLWIPSSTTTEISGTL